MLELSSTIRSLSLVEVQNKILPGQWADPVDGTHLSGFEFARIYPALNGLTVYASPCVQLGDGFKWFGWRGVALLCRCHCLEHLDNRKRPN
jgi:hypothetical protein